MLKKRIIVSSWPSAVITGARSFGARLEQLSKTLISFQPLLQENQNDTPPSTLTTAL